MLELCKLKLQTKSLLETHHLISIKGAIIGLKSLASIQTAALGD